MLITHTTRRDAVETIELIYVGLENEGAF